MRWCAIGGRRVGPDNAARHPRVRASRRRSRRARAPAARRGRPHPRRRPHRGGSRRRSALDRELRRTLRRNRTHRFDDVVRPARARRRRRARCRLRRRSRGACRGKPAQTRDSRRRDAGRNARARESATRKVSAERAYVGIGSNLGNRVVNVERALGALERLGRVVRRSSLYFTRPWGRYEQPWFYNAVALLQTELQPRALLDALKALEQELGRGSGERWGPRTIDLDLLIYDDVEMDEPGLRLPHPRLSERAFVLVPLAEIDDRFARLRDALDGKELAGVVRAERETTMAMPNESLHDATERVRSIAQFL